MPVILRTKAQDPGDPREITLDEYQQGRDNFKGHYYLQNCNSQFVGQDIAILWDDINNAVNNFIATYSVDAANVAMRFVYCYDVNSTALYLRLQILTMQQQDQSNIYDLLPTPTAWYEIRDMSFTPTPESELIDLIYLTNFYYSIELNQCDPATAQQLINDGGTTYARTITYPWLNEINLMYVDNGSPQGAYLCFGACSYLHPSGGQQDLYPHGLVLYLRTADGQDMLNNQDYVVLFCNKGCDLGTLCPPECNVYIAPVV